MINTKTRLIVLIGIMLTAVAIVAGNIFLTAVGKVHIRSGTDLTRYVNSVSVAKEVIPASRGMIYDRNGLNIARDEVVYNIICFMDENRVGIGNKEAYVKDIDYTARVLSTCLETEESKIRDLLYDAKDRYQTELGNAGRNLSEEVMLKIKESNLQGIEFYETTKRNYPLGDYFAPYIVGFAQADENGKQVGKMGVEQYLNDELNGIDGFRLYQADKNGYILPGMREEIKESINGYDVYLTLDSSIQNALQSALEQTMEERAASRAWGSVVEVKTGKILAWGQAPTFDQNKLDIVDYNNFGSQTMYEPGSVFKVFPYAAAIDTGNYDGSRNVDSGPFCYTSNKENDPVRTYDGGYGCITNSEYKDYGYIPYDYGLIYSSNTITSSVITDLIKPSVYREYLDKFGFFKRVNTDGIPELVGNINFSQPVEKLTTTYGHGLTVNMLELIQAYTAIFGNGEMLKPYFIDKIIDSYDTNKIIYQGTRNVVGQPIKESTAKELQSILERVVSDENGTARFYGVDGVKVMAKTGTSQLIENGIYQEGGSTLSSIMLAFPYEDPEYMIYYAFQNAYDKNNHYFTKPVTDLIKKISLMNNIETSDVNTQKVNIKKQEMPNLINHTLDYSKEKLSDISKDIYVLGNGNIVLEQFPETGDTVYNEQKIFLLTSDDHEFEMMDVKGWTRKEITQLWSLAGVPFKLDGYGLVSEQSIVPGATVNPDTLVEIKFEDLKE